MFEGGEAFGVGSDNVGMLQRPSRPGEDSGAPAGARQQTPDDERVESAGHLCLDGPMGDSRCPMGQADQLLVRPRRLDEGERQDPHQRAIAVGAFVRRAGGLGRRTGAERSQRLRRRGADIESPIAIGRVLLPPVPGQSPHCLVGRIEPDRQQRVEQGEHQRTIVAPRARRLTPCPLRAEDDLTSRRRWSEFVGHADRVAHDMAPHRACESFVEIDRGAHLLRPLPAPVILGQAHHIRGRLIAPFLPPGVASPLVSVASARRCRSALRVS